MCDYYDNFGKNKENGLQITCHTIKYVNHNYVSPGLGG